MIMSVSHFPLFDDSPFRFNSYLIQHIIFTSRSIDPKRSNLFYHVQEIKMISLYDLLNPVGSRTKIIIELRAFFRIILKSILMLLFVYLFVVDKPRGGH